MKVFITANYLEVTEDNDDFLFRAPSKLIRLEEISTSKVRIYTETTKQRQNHEIIVNPTTATDAVGSGLTGGLITWLMTNTGA